MSAADTPLAAETSAPQLSHVERIVNIFTAPSKTFADIKRSSNWIPAWLLISAISLAFVFVVDQKIGWDQVVENKFNSMSEKQKERLEKAPPEARAQQERGMKSGFKYGSYASPLFILAFTAFLAAIYLVALNFGLGAEIRYKEILAVVIYALVPSVLKTLLAIGAVLMISDPTVFDFENPVATNPGFLVNQSESPALYSVLSKLDIFVFWSMFLTAMGFSSVGNVKKGHAQALVFGLYATFVILALGFNLLLN